MLKFKPSLTTETFSLEQVVALPHEEIPREPELEQLFAEFLGLNVAEGHASSDTIANYKSQVRLYLQWCLDTSTNPLLATKKDIQQYRSYLIQQKYKPATIALKLNVVRRFYQGAIEQGLAKTNPAKEVKPPVHRSAPTSSIKYLELEQIKSLLALTEGDSLKLRRDRVIICLMALHGLRTIEVSKLNWGDISQQGERQLITVESKRSQRLVQLRADFSSWLFDYLATRKCPTAKTPIMISLSGNSRGQRLSRDGARRIVNSYLEQIGLRCHQDEIKLSNHALRHTFATQVYARTRDLRLVQQALGHQNPQTTAKYAHLVEGISAADEIELS